MTDKRGLFRFTTSSGTRFARIDDSEAGETNVAERDYRDRGYRPSFEGLLTREEYEACKPNSTTRVCRLHGTSGRKANEPTREYSGPPSAKGARGGRIVT
jgi:hypothetical protein